MFYSPSTKGFYSEEIHGTTMPVDVVEISLETYHELLNAQSTGFKIDTNADGAPVPVAPAPEISAERAFESVRAGLQREIDLKAKSLGFPSGGDALKGFCGYTNPFRVLAEKFGKWEADIWLQAQTYKAEVIAGTKPMLTVQEAIALIPEYPA